MLLFPAVSSMPGDKRLPPPPPSLLAAGERGGGAVDEEAAKEEAKLDGRPPMVLGPARLQGAVR
jgi:hypothetical protein